MASYTDFGKTVVRGESLTFPVSVNKGFEPFPLGSFDPIVLLARTSPTKKDADAVIFLSTDTEGIVITSSETGEFQVTIPASATHALPNRAQTLYVDIRGTDQDMTWTFAQGILVVNPAPVSLVPFAPNQIAGLRGWLRADQGTFKDELMTVAATATNDFVGGWKGQGGLTRAFRGIEVSSGYPKKMLDVLDGLPSIRFDGVDDAMVGPALSQFMTPTAFTMFIVARANALGGAFFHDASGAILLRVENDSEIGLTLQDWQSASLVTAPYNLGEFALIEAWRGSASSTINSAVTTGGLSQKVLDPNLQRTNVVLTNTSAGSLYIDFDVLAADPNSAHRVNAGSTYSVSSATLETQQRSIQEVHVYGATTGQTFTLREDTGEMGLRVDVGDEVTALVGSSVAYMGPFTAIMSYLTDETASMNGDLLEWIDYNVNVSDENKAKVRTYINRRFGVPAIQGTVS